MAPETAYASPPLPQSSTTFNPTMAIVLVCIFSVFFMICVVSAYMRQYAERHVRRAASTTQGSETVSMTSVVLGLDAAVISTFPCVLYSSVKGIRIGQAVLECAVCLNEFQDHETLRLLPKCSHVFHRDCIDMWLGSHVTCPVCRADLVVRSGEPSHVTEPLTCQVDQEIDYSSTEFLLPVEPQNITPVATTQMRRSHSTSPSRIVRPVEDIERYTLRLPNEARGLLVNMVTSLPTSPRIAFHKESSERMAFRSVSVGSTSRLDYVQFEWSNPRRPRGETSRGGFSISHIANGGNGLRPTSNSPRFFRSVRSPFVRFFQGSSRDFDAEEQPGDKQPPDIKA